MISLLSDFEYVEGAKRRHIFTFPLLDQNLLQILIYKRKTPDEILKIARDICHGIRDLHAVGIIH